MIFCLILLFTIIEFVLNWTLCFYLKIGIQGVQGLKGQKGELGLPGPDGSVGLQGKQIKSS